MVKVGVTLDVRGVQWPRRELASAVDNTSRTIQASTHKDTVKNSPSLSTNQEMTPEYEGQVRSYYRL